MKHPIAHVHDYHYMNDYLKEEPGRCISCPDCMKGPQKGIVQYKYSKGLDSEYHKTYNKFDPKARHTEFNLDKEKALVKTGYKPKGDYYSHYKVIFLILIYFRKNFKISQHLHLN